MKKPLLILAGVFILAAVIVYWYVKKPIKVQATEWRHDNSGWFVVQMPGGQWVDTGMWVSANYMVIGHTNNGPFTLSVGNVSREATLSVPPSSFATVINTFEKTVPPELDLSSSPFAHVVEQEKIYLYSDNPVEIHLRLDPFEYPMVDGWNKLIDEYNNILASKRRDKGLIVAGASVVLVVILIILGYVRHKKYPKETQI